MRFFVTARAGSAESLCVGCSAVPLGLENLPEPDTALKRRAIVESSLWDFWAISSNYSYGVRDARVCKIETMCG
jgi:hypothetical protein